MQLSFYLQNSGAIITLVLGVIALVSPAVIQRFVSVRAIGKEGLSEIRATYGGFFVGLGVCALFYQYQLLFMMLGIAWSFAGIVRFVTLFFGSMSLKNISGALFELTIGCLCLSGMLLD